MDELRRREAAVPRFQGLLRRRADADDKLLKIFESFREVAVSPQLMHTGRRLSSRVRLSINANARRAKNIASICFLKIIFCYQPLVGKLPPTVRWLPLRKYRFCPHTYPQGTPTVGGYGKSR